MAKRGRKSLVEEYAILQRYADLTPLVFKFYRECLEGTSKDDKKWASQELNKALVKMIPQDITSGGDTIYGWTDYKDNLSTKIVDEKTPREQEEVDSSSLS